MGDGVGRRHAVGAPVGDRARHRRAARDRVVGRDPGVSRGAGQPPDPERDRRRRRRRTHSSSTCAAACPWGLRCTIERVAVGDPFVGSLDGPGYESLKAAMEEAYGRELTTEGQGGSIPLCNVFAETYPDAEIMLMGVEEPKCLIHAPNESVDPSEIEHLALAEALFLEQLRGGGAMSTRPFTTHGLRAADGARREAGVGRRSDRRARDARARTSCTSPDTCRSRSPSGSRCWSIQAGRPPAMIVPILERARRRGRARGAAAGRARGLDRRRRPVRGDRARCSTRRALRDLRLGVGDARARPAGARCPSRATSR